jgi:hypothetical protein
MPGASTVHRWLQDDVGEFREQYALACAQRRQFWEEDILDIADDSSNDWIERRNEKTGAIERVVDHENIQRSRLRVDARKWLLSKLEPKKWGERQQVDMNATVVAAQMTDERRDAILRANGLERLSPVPLSQPAQS